MPEKTETQALFQANKNFAIRIKDSDQADFLNSLFLKMNIDSDLSKTQQFLEFAYQVQKMLEVDNTSVSMQISDLLEEKETLLAAQETLLEEKETLLEEKETLLEEMKTLENSVSGLQDSLEDERNKTEKTVSNPVNKSLAINQVLVNLPPFQHHLLAKVANNSTLHEFYSRVTKARGLFVPLPNNIENKRELMAVVLLNIFIGTILNFHKGSQFLPNLDRVSKYGDITAAINYAEKKELEEKEKGANPPPNE